MTPNLPAEISADTSLILPPAIAEYFTAAVRNPNTRAAYARAVVRFLSWVRDHGLSLHQVQPVQVAG